MVNSDTAESNVQLLRDRWIQRRDTSRTTADFLLYLCEHQSNPYKFDKFIWSLIKAPKYYSFCKIV